MDIYRDEPGVDPEDTEPIVETAYPQMPINTRGLDIEYLFHPEMVLYRAVAKGAFSAYLKKRGWKAVTQKEYEVCK